MKGIPIGPLAQWGKDLTYYFTPFFCLVNWDMHNPGSACRGTDLPSGRLLYIRTETFTWFTPPGPYRATTCRERELTLDHIHTFLTTQRHDGPPRMRDQLNAGPRPRQHERERLIHTIHIDIHANKVNMKGWLWQPNDIRGPCGPKASWHLSYRWWNTSKKPHPGNLSLPGIEPEPFAWQARIHRGERMPLLRTRDLDLLSYTSHSSW